MPPASWRSSSQHAASAVRSHPWSGWLWRSSPWMQRISQVGHETGRIATLSENSGVLPETSHHCGLTPSATLRAAPPPEGEEEECKKEEQRGGRRRRVDQTDGQPVVAGAEFGIRLSAYGRRHPCLVADAPPRPPALTIEGTGPEHTPAQTTDHRILDTPGAARSTDYRRRPR